MACLKGPGGMAVEWLTVAEDVPEKIIQALPKQIQAITSRELLLAGVVGTRRTAWH